LTTQLVVVQKALSMEKSARCAADRSIAKEKTTRQAVEQALMNSEDAKVKLAQ
jgi:chromosome segregation ATPase